MDTLGPERQNFIDIMSQVAQGSTLCQGYLELTSTAMGDSHHLNMDVYVR